MLVLFGLLAGFAIPPTSSVLRSMWPSLLADRPHLLQPAYALDSVLIELIFILGPLLTGLLTAIAAPQVALIVSAVSVVAGTLAVHRAAALARVAARARGAARLALGRARARPACAAWC